MEDQAGVIPRAEADPAASPFGAQLIERICERVSNRWPKPTSWIETFDYDHRKFALRFHVWAYCREHRRLPDGVHEVAEVGPVDFGWAQQQ